MMIQSHESCVNHNAKSYKEINKWIEDNKREELCQLDIAATAIPHAENLHQLDTERVEPLLQTEKEHVTHQQDVNQQVRSAVSQITSVPKTTWRKV